VALGITRRVSVWNARILLKDFITASFADCLLLSAYIITITPEAKQCPCKLLRGKTGFVRSCVAKEKDRT
jgi:hypothetical protein